ncbi:MAG: hypothetical protein VYA60_11010 [Pseudomonadota bacterium]|nr:hypothetical protein [Pseudomonadota bacterium]
MELYWATLNRLRKECKVDHVQLYAYKDTIDVYERGALLIEGKLHWLDLQNFSLAELKGHLEVVGLCLNEERKMWGVYDGLVGIPYIDLYIEHFDREKQDVNLLATTVLKGVTTVGSPTEPWWGACELAEHFELGEPCDEDEYEHE